MTAQAIVKQMQMTDDNTSDHDADDDDNTSDHDADDDDR